MAGKQKLDEISLAAVASTKGTSNENHNIKIHAMKIRTAVQNPDVTETMHKRSGK